MRAKPSSRQIERIRLVCMVDLDNFKAINDTFGHLAGDEVLKHVTRALSTPEATVGRFGGDEFLVIIAGSPAKARFFARRVEEPLANIELEGGLALPVRISFGFAHYPAEAVTGVELIRLADVDMYRTRRVNAAARRVEAG
jgi:diguanylate cyclase (GGDEF)-like protein